MKRTAQIETLPSVYRIYTRLLKPLTLRAWILSRLRKCNPESCARLSMQVSVELIITFFNNRCTTYIHAVTLPASREGETAHNRIYMHTWIQYPSIMQSSPYRVDPAWVGHWLSEVVGWRADNWQGSCCYRSVIFYFFCCIFIALGEALWDFDHLGFNNSPSTTIYQ